MGPFCVSGTASGGTWRFRKVKKNSMLPKQKTLNNSLGKKVMVPFFLQRLISFATQIPVDFFLFSLISASLFLSDLSSTEKKLSNEKCLFEGQNCPPYLIFSYRLGWLLKNFFISIKLFSGNILISTGVSLHLGLLSQKGTGPSVSFLVPITFSFVSEFLSLFSLSTTRSNSELA